MQTSKIQSSTDERATRESLVQRLSPLLPDQDVVGLAAAFDTQGFCVIPELLGACQLERQREALAPWIDDGLMGRNVFEGTHTHRIYAMLARDPVFAVLVAHPVSLAWAEHYLGPSCLLSPCLAIHLQPGESA